MKGQWYGPKARKEWLAANGFCPVCEIRMTSAYHINCPGIIHTDESLPLDA